LNRGTVRYSQFQISVIISTLLSERACVIPNESITGTTGVVLILGTSFSGFHLVFALMKRVVRVYSGMFAEMG
jgi:hypothetical protein